MNKIIIRMMKITPYIVIFRSIYNQLQDSSYLYPKYKYKYIILDPIVK